MEEYIVKYLCSCGATKTTTSQEPVSTESLALASFSAGRRLNKLNASLINEIYKKEEELESLEKPKIYRKR